MCLQIRVRGQQKSIETVTFALLSSILGTTIKCASARNSEVYSLLTSEGAIDEVFIR
jgi:hypothetical protein